MYCVKCGVRLQEGTESCPLCGTPVWNPEGVKKEKTFSDIYPETRNIRAAVATTLTFILAFACYLVWVICHALYGELRWGGYVLAGVGLAYVLFVLPLWFRQACPLWFIGADHLAAGLFLLFICRKTGGNWFLSFGFPVVLLSLVWQETAVALYRYVRGGRFYITGGITVLMGGFLILLELFQHITFGTPMFSWSLFAAVPCAVLGLFFIAAGIIRPLGNFIRQHFFI